MDKEQFIEYVLSGGPESVPETEPSSKGVVRPKGFAGKGFKAKAKKTAEPTNRQSTFAKRLLEAAGFGVPEEVASTTLIRGDDAAARYLPERVFYWPKTSQRPYQTLLFETDTTHRELLEIPAFRKRAMDHLDIVEDALARLVQQALRGFERGGEGVTADIKKGRQEETLCIVSIVDEREAASVRLVCFGTTNAKTSGLETFQITEQTRFWEPQLARDYLALLYQRQFGQLEGNRWQEAFTTSEERKQAQRLIQVCSKGRPKEDEIQECVMDLLDEIAKSFGLRRKPRQPRRLQAFALPPDHDIGIDPDSRATVEVPSNPFRGIAIQDEKNRLLGYIVYCLDQKKDADTLRSRLAEYNRFHNVLVVYPDGTETALELWQGREMLVGKMKKDGPQFHGESEVVNLLSRFFVVSKAKVRDPEDLAEELAFRARYLRTLAKRQLDSETSKGHLRKLYNAFRAALIHDQTEDEFSDAYAQTLTYGLLTARWLSKDEYASTGERFTRQNAADHLHLSEGFLRDFYRSAMKATVGQSRLEWLLDDIANLLDRVSLDDVFASSSTAADISTDPVIHFYEPFLNAYDAEARQRRGVYYTPRPVVSYIVRSAHRILQEDFDLAGGLASTVTWEEMAAKDARLTLPEGTSPEDPFVTILDPATGTATFLVEVITTVYETLVASWQKQGLTSESVTRAWNEYVPTHLLPRLFGYEVMMAPYAIAHMKVALKLRDTGYELDDGAPTEIYLTNTLEPPEEISGRLAFDVPSLARQANAVNAIKQRKSFTVILGNPPYSNFGQLNRNDWVDRLLADYKQGLNERKLNLDDDFIKFVRMAHSRINSTGCGIVGFITANTYLDGLTHRRMRESLIETFDLLYLYDLHGNINKREQAPDGSPDENVFDIRQGVSIGLFVKRTAQVKSPSVLHHDSYGVRADKYSRLDAEDASTTQFITVACTAPRFFFVPKAFGGEAEYVTWPAVTDIFTTRLSGVHTKRDKLTIQIAREDIESVEVDFRTLSEKEIRSKYHLPKDGRDWKLPLAISDIKDNAPPVVPIAYRPFDERYTLYSGKTKGFLAYPRKGMSALLDSNVGFVFKRQAKEDNADYTYFFVVGQIVSEGIFAIDPKGREYIAPLYLSDQTQQGLLHSEAGPEVNLHHNAMGLFEKATGLVFDCASTRQHAEKGDAFDEWDFLSYVYGIVHSQTYRRNYKELLKVDYPRIPVPRTNKVFWSIGELGKQLLAVHLAAQGALSETFVVERPRFEPPDWSGLTTLDGCDRTVAPGYPKYSESTIWINRASGFHGVNECIWESMIGGYQVCKKWLGDRKRRAITASEEERFGKVILCLQQTQTLVGEIESVIHGMGGWDTLFGVSREDES